MYDELNEESGWNASSGKTAPFHATAHHTNGEWRTCHRSSKFGVSCNARVSAFVYIRLTCVHAERANILGSLETAFEESYDLAIPITLQRCTLGRNFGRAMARPTRPIPAAMSWCTVWQVQARQSIERLHK